jgi:hypothetical protein
MTILQNAGNLIKQDKNLSKLIGELPFEVDSYNMSTSQQSSFLDIGSGFGKPVFHSVM